MATNNSDNDGTRTANGIYIANGVSAPTFQTLTNGQLLIGDTSAAPQAATLTAGSGITITNGAGTISLAASGSGGTGTFTLVASATASNQANVSFAGCFTSTYNCYLIIAYGVVGATNTSGLVGVFGTGATPTWITGAGSYCGNAANLDYAGTGVGTGGTSLATIPISYTPITNAGSMPISMFGYVQNPSNTSYYTSMYGLANSNIFEASESGNVTFQGCYLTAGAITSLRLQMVSGNINVGTFQVWGMVGS